jgi:hypothetical protein
MKQWSCPGNAEQQEPWKSTEGTRMPPTHETRCMTVVSLSGARSCRFVTNNAHSFLFDVAMERHRNKVLLAQHHTTEAAEAVSGK